ncbi:tetratricopeptide repeat protein [Anaerobacterium chartisolvens]|nr:tetratricopeptide repeat protein [Anaerobacterium chartisolvens]
MNKNISRYKDQLNSESKLKSDFQLNLNSSLDLNKKLTEDLKLLNEDISKEKDIALEAEKKAEELQSRLKNTMASYEALIEAQRKYDDGEYVTSALLLYEKCKLALFDKEAYNQYVKLKELVFPKASKISYSDGLKNYKQGQYSKAIEYFKISTALASNEYYSDDCYYLMAYSYFYMKDNIQAKKSLETLFKNYPESTYLKKANILSEMMK